MSNLPFNHIQQAFFLIHVLLILMSYFVMYVTADFFAPFFPFFLSIFLTFHNKKLMLAADMQCCSKYSHGRSTSSK